MLSDPFRITNLSITAPLTLSLVFADQFMTSVELHGWVDDHPDREQLEDPDFFSRVELDRNGLYVFWSDDIDFAADNLRNLAIEQAGKIGHERILNWMYRNNLTRVQAASALGISSRTLSRYMNSGAPVPRMMWLACLGWEASSPVGDGLPVDLLGSAHRRRVSSST